MMFGRMTNFAAFVLNDLILAKCTIYQLNYHSLANYSTFYLRTQMELYLMGSNEDSSDTHFLCKKPHSQKSFPVVLDQAVA